MSEVEPVNTEAQTAGASQRQRAAASAFFCIPRAGMQNFGRQTATTILAELPAVERLPSAQSAAAYCGLAPREYTSGASVR